MSLWVIGLLFSIAYLVSSSESHKAKKDYMKKHFSLIAYLCLMSVFTVNSIIDIRDESPIWLCVDVLMLFVSAIGFLIVFIAPVRD